MSATIEKANSANPGIAELFANVDRRLATHPDPRTFLEAQIGTWENRMVQLEAWAKGAAVERPCNGELDAWEIADILLRLHVRLGGLDKRAA